MPDPGSPRATALISFAVKPEHNASHAAWQQEIAMTAAAIPGFKGIEHIPPTPDIQDHWLTILRFNSGEHLRGWLESPERAALNERRAH